MSTKNLTSDMLSYAQARGYKLTYTQAAALAAINRSAIKTEPLTRGYWRQLNRIISNYLAHQSTKDRVCGTFAA